MFINSITNSVVPNGKPVVLLHGGPGAGFDSRLSPLLRPVSVSHHSFRAAWIRSKYPHASLDDNTTWHLVEDIEKIREQFGVNEWLVFGGSWGSTLALAYAETHPERVKGLVLRGIFCAVRKRFVGSTRTVRARARYFPRTTRPT